jgi:hypothetical protein
MAAEAPERMSSRSSACEGQVGDIKGYSQLGAGGQKAEPSLVREGRRLNQVWCGRAKAKPSLVREGKG